MQGLQHGAFAARQLYTTLHHSDTDAAIANSNISQIAWNIHLRQVALNLMTLQRLQAASNSDRIIPEKQPHPLYITSATTASSAERNVQTCTTCNKLFINAYSLDVNILFCFFAFNSKKRLSEINVKKFYLNVEACININRWQMIFIPQIAI